MTRLSPEASAWQTRSVPKPNETRLRAVLFTDVVSSTELAREMGDVGWTRLLEAQRRVIRRLLRSMGGREVDTAGDGFFAVFDRTADAVRCAFAACREVQELGLDIRAGVHVGEVELAGHEVHGIVVHTGARVMGQAGASEVLVTATVKDLVAGARFDLRERGTVELKGVPGTWTLYDVMAVDEQLRPAPIEQASVASERRDRVASSPLGGGRGRRWILPVAAAAVVIAVVAAYELTRTEPTSVPAPGTVARIDDAGRFDEPVPLASVPTGIAWGEGRLWVTDQRGQVYWLDPESGESGSRGAAGVPTGVAVGDGAVWVTNGFGVGDGADGGVSRIDPVGESLEPAFATPTGSEAIAWGADRVWVTDTATGHVRVYDPVTHEVLDPVTLPAGSGEPPRPEQIVVGPRGDVVWVGDAAAGRVFRLDATTPTDDRHLHGHDPGHGACGERGRRVGHRWSRRPGHAARRRDGRRRHVARRGREPLQPARGDRRRPRRGVGRVLVVAHPAPDRPRDADRGRVARAGGRACGTDHGRGRLRVGRRPPA